VQKQRVQLASGAQWGEDGYLPQDWMPFQPLRCAGACVRGSQCWPYAICMIRRTIRVSYVCRWGVAAYGPSLVGVWGCVNACCNLQPHRGVELMPKKQSADACKCNPPLPMSNFPATIRTGVHCHKERDLDELSPVQLPTCCAQHPNPCCAAPHQQVAGQLDAGTVKRCVGGCWGRGGLSKGGHYQAAVQSTCLLPLPLPSACPHSCVGGWAPP